MAHIIHLHFNFSFSPFLSKKSTEIFISALNQLKLNLIEEIG